MAYPCSAVERAMKVQEVILRALDGKLTWPQAADILGRSPRSIRRLLWKLEHFGFDGLFDRRRHRPSPKRAPVAEIQRVLALYRDRYQGFNVRHFHQLARRQHGVRFCYAFVKRALLPNLKQLAVLWNPSNPMHTLLRKDWGPVARSLAIQLQWLPAVNPDDLAGAFRSAARDAAAILVLADAMFLGHRARIAALAADARLPTLFIASGHVEAGGLMSYGPDSPDLFRRAATYVDKILKGAKPGDLPIEQPTKFEFVINLKTAKALGLTIPPSLLLQATRIIE